jgi:hypothetical protein
MGDPRVGALEHAVKGAIARVLYAALFVVVLPAALVAWAGALHGEVHAPAIRSAVGGAGLMVLGLGLMAVGMLALWTRGGGLPMNAFPPPRFVASGIYALLPHPIYYGFIALCAGAAIFRGSAAGLWLVTPTVALASFALVLGYESPDLRARFGTSAARPVICADDATQPSVVERTRCCLLVLLPWLVGYEAVVALGLPKDAVSSYLPWESRLPVWPWTEALYASTYVVVALTPWLVQSRRALRSFAVRGWVAMAVAFPVYLAIPLLAEPRAFAVHGVWGQLLTWERTLDSPAAAFPSFHVLWAFVAADALREGSRVRAIALFSWATLISLSCITTGMHSLLDVVAGLALYGLVAHAGALWRQLLALTEALANSWREWRVGPLRIIGHGSYGAVAVLVWIFLMNTLLGPGKGAMTAALFAGGAIGAALWAQWVEGSPVLLRPFGFYGGMLGTIAAAFLAPLFGMSAWIALCAVCVGAPWLQAIGRLRCLVQGCCHGRISNTGMGIRYTHPRSRVTRLAGLAGMPLYPTPLYSILWNGLIALALFRLVALGARTTMICGVYLILSGVGRFVEEAYRGEPQTAVFGGLRFYQWIAIASVVTGGGITTIRSAPFTPAPSLHFTSLAVATGCALAGWAVSGVDFPKSARRFARLT